MIDLTLKEMEVIYLKQVECYSQDDIASKLNYSKRQVQRIQKSAETKLINSLIPHIIDKYNKLERS